MALSKLRLRPGVNTQLTQTANEGGWFACNLIRWKDGLLQKLGGWLRLFDTQAAGFVRALHAYEDLTLVNNLCLGTDGGLQIWANDELTNIRLMKDGGIVATLGISQGVTGNFVTVTQLNHGYSVFDQVYVTIPQNIGLNLLPVGLHTIITVPSVDTYTFNVPFGNSSGFTVVSVPPSFTPSANSTTTAVTLAVHGLSPGDSFVVDYDVVDTDTFPLDPSLWVTYVKAGTYTVDSVISSSAFRILNPLRFVTVPPSSFTEYNTDGDTPVYKFLANPTDEENWFLDNLGQNLTVSYEGGPIFLRSPPQAIAVQIENGPQVNAGSFVAMPQAQIIAFGASVSNLQDPLLLAWSDAGDAETWTASSANQAGTYRLSRGSRIVGGLQAPQSTLIWTDLDLWSMQYIGPPFIYGFNVVGSGCGLLAPHARATLGRTTYWMNQSGFFVFGDSGVQRFQCDVWDVVFPNIDTENAHKCFCGANSSFTELWAFYPSADGDGECDSYAKVNLSGQQPLWDYGTLSRTAWIDQSVFGQPLAADINKRIQQHETGYDDDDEPMSGAYAETGYTDLSEGTEIIFLDQIIPDMKWLGDTTGAASLKLQTQSYPGGQTATFGPYSMTPTTQYISTRLRARQVALRIDWASRSGFNARFGMFRARTAPAGRLP